MPGTEFWDSRYAEPGWAYGDAPNAFVASQADRFPKGTAVVELGAGEGRNAAFLARRGCSVTAVDASAQGLAKVGRLPGGSAVDTIQTDVTTWEPARQWDGVVTTFLHLPPDQRPGLFRLLQRIVRPGGMMVAEWYRPEHRQRGWHGGPPTAEMMMSATEIKAHLPESGVQMLTEADVELSEGAYHQGPSAVVRLVWIAPAQTEEGPNTHRNW